MDDHFQNNIHKRDAPTDIDRTATMKASIIATLVLLTLGSSSAFTSSSSPSLPASAALTVSRCSCILYSTTKEDEQTATAPSDVASSIDPKDAVRVFGRLAEKYIMLDESGGMCCYSACKDCEYRLPDGGYRMADQQSSRPKWIPVYEERKFASQGKEHIAKWKSGIFGVPDDNNNNDSSSSCSSKPSVTKEEFVSALVDLDYAPPLGGPFVAASSAALEDTKVAGHLFELLAGGKEKLSRHKMSLQLKEMAGGEQGLTWPAFQAALGL